MARITSNRLHSVPALGWAILLAAGLAFVTPTAEAQKFEFPRTEEFVVLEYTVANPMLRPPSKPRLTIFGDGRVVAFYSHPWRDAGQSWRDPGDYEFTLPPAELDAVLAQLAASGLLTAKSGEIRALQKAAEDRQAASGAEAPISDDLSGARLKVALTRYAPAESPESASPLDHEVYWSTLYRYPLYYPQATELHRLHAAEHLLNGLASRSDLRQGHG